MKLAWRHHYTLIGKLVAEIDQRGCMAETHTHKRLGEIVAIDDQRVFLCKPGAVSMTVARCRTLSSRELAEPEYFLVPIEDGAFQPSENPYLFYWRH